MRRFVGICTLLVSAALFAQSSPVPDQDWKAWLNEVAPLLTGAEKSAARKAPAQERDRFREDFWARRNPNGLALDNPRRTEFELRVHQADKRFRNGNGTWNDCGVTFAVLGKPDRVVNRQSAAHFAGPDGLQAFREDDDVVAEVWAYRNPVGLPASPQEYAFRFTRNCETLNGPGFYRLMESAAASYVVAR